ncbi:MAG: hypothetical protein QM817_41890 [Archangium sp.]
MHTLKGRKAVIDVGLVHADEHDVWLLKTAMLSMLYESLDEARKVSDAVREVYEAAGGDEPEDADAASEVLEQVKLVKVLRGKLASRTPQRVRFDRHGEGPRAAPLVRVELTFTSSALLAHLKKGLSWSTAPLFSELEEDSEEAEAEEESKPRGKKRIPRASPKAPARRSAIFSDRVMYLGRSFPFNARVRIAQRAGVFGAARTGGPEVDALPPATGVLLEVDESFRRMTGADRYVVRVKWDAQSWQTWPEHRAVDLPSFETTTHLDYLDLA